MPCVAAAAPTQEDGREIAAKALARLALFGALPPSILPVLLGVRAMLLDGGKGASANRKVLRLANYMIQLACSDGSAGTPMPFSPLTGGCGAAGLCVFCYRQLQ